VGCYHRYKNRVPAALSGRSVTSVEVRRLLLLLLLLLLQQQQQQLLLLLPLPLILLLLLPTIELDGSRSGIEVVEDPIVTTLLEQFKRLAYRSSSNRRRRRRRRRREEGEH